MTPNEVRSLIHHELTMHKSDCEDVQTGIIISAVIISVIISTLVTGLMIWGFTNH